MSRDPISEDGALADSGLPKASLPAERTSLSASDPLEVSREDDFLYYLRRGAELLHRGLNADARGALERACELRPDSAKAQNLLGLAYFKLGMLEPARAIYERLIQLHPHETPLHVNLGLVLLREGKLDEAESALRTALMLTPDHVRAHCYLGFTLYRRGDLVNAREHFLRGAAPEFAKKLESKIARGDNNSRSSWVSLKSVVEAGLSGIESAANPFRQALQEPNAPRDEAAWETQVAHQRPRELEMALPMTPIPVPAPAPPGSDRPASPRGFLFDTIDLAFASVPITTMAPGVRRPAPSPAIDLPLMPFVEPALRLFEDLAWVPGFSAGREIGPQARLVLSGQAYLRRSAILAALGEMRTEKVKRLEPGGRSDDTLLGGGGDPIFRLIGEGKLLLRVWHLAAAVRDTTSLVVVESALVGFDGGFGFESRKIEGLDLVRLEGRGSLLLDSPGPPVAVALGPETPLWASADAVLAWSDGVVAESSPAGSGHLSLRGRGLVFIAAPDRDLAPQPLVSKL